MKDTLNQQAEIIDRGKQVELPLNEIVHPLDIPVIFSAKDCNLTFHELDLGANDLQALAPDVVVSDTYEYHRTIVVKRDGKSMIAFCTGVDSLTPDNLPIAAIFNLTKPSRLKVLVLTRGGKRIHALENYHVPSGGLELSRLLSGNPNVEPVQIFSNRFSFFIDARD